MIVYKTNMERLPESCKDCTCTNCHLPQKKNTYRDEIKKAYTKKRHEECPLMELEER